MKKTAAALLMAAMLAGNVSFGSSAAYAAGATVPRVIVYGEEMNFEIQPYIANGALYVEAIPLFRKLGLTAQWDAGAGKLVGSGLNAKVELLVGAGIAKVNGKATDIVFPLQLRDDRPMVPLRWMANVENAELRWSDSLFAAYLKPSVKTQARFAADLQANYSMSGDLDGYVRLYDSDRLVFRGVVENGEPDGSGELWLANGVVYAGQFRGGKPSGYGELFVHGVKTYKGEWSDGRMQGRGTELGKDGKAVYEGDFFNNRREGQGRLYKDEKLVYEGEWRQGKANGYGSFYYTNGLLEYEGEFRDHAPNGYGRWYDYDMDEKDAAGSGSGQNRNERIVRTARIVEGRFADGRIAGETKQYVYVGEFAGKADPRNPGSFGKGNGLGKLYEVRTELDFYGRSMTRTELVYDGSFVDYRRHGFGDEYADGVLKYSGAWSRDSKNGTGYVYEGFGGPLPTNAALGTMTIKEMSYPKTGLPITGRTYRYIGGISGGKPSGTGKLYLLRDPFAQHVYAVTLSDGEKAMLLYEGGFAAGLKSGEGKLYESGILSYDGGFREDLKSGTGKSYDPKTGRLVYAGSYLNDLRHGQGIAYDPETGVKRYEGMFVADWKDGEGKEYEYGYLVYEGSFKKGLREGQGKLYHQGALIFSGQFHNGQAVNGGTASAP